MIANAATRSAIDGSDFGDNVLAALPDTIAQTLGSILTDKLSKALEKASRNDSSGDAMVTGVTKDGEGLAVNGGQTAPATTPDPNAQTAPGATPTLAEALAKAFSELRNLKYPIKLPDGSTVYGKVRFDTDGHPIGIDGLQLTREQYKFAANQIFGYLYDSDKFTGAIYKEGTGDGGVDQHGTAGVPMITKPKDNVPVEGDTALRQFVKDITRNGQRRHGRRWP